MYHYAQINNKNIVVGLSNLKNIVNSDNMILLDSENSNLIGKKYENGKFVEIYTEPHVLTYEEQKARYLILIRDAKDLGDDDEVLRLQQEWKDFKNSSELIIE